MGNTLTEEQIAGQLRQDRMNNSTKDKIAEKITTPARAGTSALLRSAWMSITTVFGFIFIGLPYINLHVFGKMVLGEKFFCKLGDEWIPKKIKSATGEAGKLGGKSIGIFEIIGLIFLDIAVLFVLLSVLLIIILLVKIIENPEEAIDIFGFGFIWGAIKLLF